MTPTHIGSITISALAPMAVTAWALPREIAAVLYVTYSKELCKALYVRAIDFELLIPVIRVWAEDIDRLGTYIYRG